MEAKIRRILCPVDFSESAARALSYALSLAKTLTATVDVVHVYQLPVYALPDGAFMAGPEFAADLSDRLQKQLDALMAQNKSETALGKAHLVEGAPHQEINALATKSNFDLIVMGTHGRTGIAHAILGSVAERVVRASRCPVLTVPAPRESTK